MNRLTRPALGGLLAAAMSMTAVAATVRPRADVECKLDAAIVEYESNHWQRAYARFTESADAGCAEAARVSLLMWLYAERLYASDFIASREQLSRWQQLVCDNACENALAWCPAGSRCP